MKILELFSGTTSVSKVFIKHGHQAYTIDWDEDFHPDWCADVMTLSAESIRKYFGVRSFDVIWASPPCECFSVASISKHWTGGIRVYKPKTDECKLAIRLIKKTLSLIEGLGPRFWFIENPRGVLRKLDFMKDLPRQTVTYCQYGDDRMKPTDIWTNCKKWTPRRMCRNGDTCHVSAPRGAKTGTQGRRDAVERAKIPTSLCKEIMRACGG